MPYRGKLRLLGRACLAFAHSCGKTEGNPNLAVVVASSRNFSASRALNMRFVQFTSKSGGPQHLGVQLKQGGDIIAVSAVDSRIPNTLRKFLEGGDDLLKKAKREDDIDLRKAVERLVLSAFDSCDIK